MKHCFSVLVLLRRGGQSTLTLKIGMFILIHENINTYRFWLVHDIVEAKLFVVAEGFSFIVT